MKKILFLQHQSFDFLKKLFAVLALISFSFSVNAQSDTALNFDGSNDRVDLPNILTASYTKEAWVYAPLDNGAFNNQNIVSGAGTAFWFPGNQGFQLSSGHAFPFNAVQDPVPMVANTWTHVAVTYNAGTTTMSLYKNGILVSTNNAVPNHAENTLYIGAFVGANYYKGLIDEVRIWSVALTQAEIRDWMVRSVTPTHPQYANMIAYYNADVVSATTVEDSRNNNDGTIVGTTWDRSGASIGDSSVHDYVNVIKTAGIRHVASGDSLGATETAGAPLGIHVYYVDSIPNNRTGTVGTGGNNKYFGVFVVGGTATTFDAVYTYNTGNVESALRLYERFNNASATWADAAAVQNMTANTLTDAGQTGISVEYILGSTNFPLPVKFTNFTLTKERSGVKLSWTTAEEVNNTGFVIQRSSNGNKWQDLSFVSARNSVNQTYGYLDANPAKGLNYFRLKQTDSDGKFTYSEVRSINFLNKRGITLYPSPATDKIVLDFDNEALLNTEGKIVNANGTLIKRFTIKSLQEHIPIASLSKGVYMLQLADGSVHKFIKQ